MKIIKVDLGKRSYNIYIGKGVLKKLPSLLKLSAPDTPIFVVTNKKINTLHGGGLKKVLKKLGKNILFHEVPDSERAKSFPVYIKTIKRLARFARKIKPLVIAFGGGVIGDLTGFVASAYRRGVPYIQIPTTLLSQVDSAIGGKVAIDIKEAKNIVGDFYQPKMVICDTALMGTLPEKELRNGLAEVVKYGIIKDSALFSFLEKNIKKLLEGDARAMEYVVFKSCLIKAKVVEIDECDTKDVRAILNFGHTLGHAIEAASSYSRLITHGRAVAIGMIMAGYIALKRGMLKKKSYDRMCSLIGKIYLERKKMKIKIKDILEALSYDKKFISGSNKFILPKKIGLVKIAERIPSSLIKEAIEKNI